MPLQCLHLLLHLGLGKGPSQSDKLASDAAAVRSGASLLQFFLQLVDLSLTVVHGLNNRAFITLAREQLTDVVAVARGTFEPQNRRSKRRELLDVRADDLGGLTDAAHVFVRELRELDGDAEQPGRAGCYAEWFGHLVG